MKNLLKIALLFIITGILLPSCSSKLTVAKRHYKKGYYISFVKNKQSGHTTEAKEKETKRAYALNKATGQPAQKEQVQTAANLVAVASEKARDNSTVIKNETKPASAYKAPAFLPLVKHTVQRLPESRSSMAHSSDDEALSLFWIVIVVILILWVLGLLAGGFGLGILINLLLIVALVLLILWLLKVV